MNKKEKSTKKGSSLSKTNKRVIIILEVAVLLTVVLATCAVFGGKLSLKPSEAKETGNTEVTNNTIQYKVPPTFAETESSSPKLTVPNGDNGDSSIPTFAVTSSQSGYGDSGYVQNSNNNNYSNNNNSYNNSNTQSQNSSASSDDPSTWSKSKILSEAKNAISKTKSYTGKVSVAHKEGFDANVTECTGGSVVASVANLLIGWVVSPVDETLNFDGGKAVNSEGETVQILLPKKDSFTLSESGLSTASARRSGDEYIITLGLVRESVDLYGIPKHNASAIGYLDVGSLDISFMDVDKADITYKGSTVELHINSNGYVTSASYTIPLHVEGAAHRGSISGSAVFDGVQTEQWTFNW